MNTKSPPRPLRLARLERGLSMQDVAEKLRARGARISGLTTLHRWETGVLDVPPDVAPILARILGRRKLP